MTSRILVLTLFVTALAIAPDRCFAQDAPKNHEKLNEHLGWLIGEWSGEITTADNQVLKVNAKFKWVAHEQVIRLDLSLGDWEGLSMIFWDTSDKTIKMWGANSAGGNGRATMRVEGDELVWTNTVYDIDGEKTVGDFSYTKQNATTLVVKYTDAADGKEKMIKLTKSVK